MSSASQDRGVLAAVPSVAAAHRLFDVVECLAGVRNVAVTWTVIPDSALNTGVRETLGRHRVSRDVVEWEAACRSRHDLVLAVGCGNIDDLRGLDGPLLIVPEGSNGFESPPGAENVSDIPGSGAFGLSREYLMRDDGVVPRLIGVTNHTQLTQLAQGCPEAVDRGTLMGDVTIERLLTSREARSGYRRVLGVGEDEILAVLCSTWGRGALLDTLLEQIDTLPERFRPWGRVALVLHPNITAVQPDLINTHLVPAIRNGLIVIEPNTPCCSALVAADVIVGDHGSVSLYAAVLDVAMLLAPIASAVSRPVPPLRRLAGLAPLLNPGEDLVQQILRAHSTHESGWYEPVVEQITLSGRQPASHDVRAIVYDLLGCESSEDAAVSLVADRPVVVPELTVAPV